MFRRMLRSVRAISLWRREVSLLALLVGCASDAMSTDDLRGPGAGAVAPVSGASGSPAAGSSAGRGAATIAPTTAGAGVVAAVGGSGGDTNSTGGSSGDSAAAGRSAAGDGAAGGGAAGAPGTAGAGGVAGSDGAAGVTGSGDSGDGETGRLVGMTAAHNVVRARLMNPKPEPALPPLKWSTEIADIAQAYADELASSGPDCMERMAHSNRPGFGENLAGYSGFKAAAKDVVEGWSSEEECYTFGPISRMDCDLTCAREEASSNGCGHYTQVVWRGTTEVGCGVATCESRRGGDEIWVCNYRQPGNVLGREPY